MSEIVMKHTVAQGECIESIANDYGIFDPQKILDIPENEQLFQDRPNPRVLFPGDKVAIPKIEKKYESVSTEQRHIFMRKNSLTELRIDFSNAGISDLNCEYVMELDGFDRTIQGNLSEGKLETNIRYDAKNAKLTLTDVISGIQQKFDLTIGGLCPVTTLEGVQGRLKMAGLYNGPIDGKWGPKTAAAIREFQELETVDDCDKKYGKPTIDALSKYSQIEG